MKLQNLNAFPVLGKEYESSDYLNLDLSVSNTIIKGIDVVSGLDAHIKSALTNANKKVGIGGYAEERDFYWTSPLFKSEKEKRTIHLGIDLWTSPMHRIFAPLDGIVHSVKYNNLPLDYGYTVLLKHSIDGFTFYALYGHLSDKDMNYLAAGDQISKGEVFAYIGHPETNGGWAPHLHLQFIKDLEGSIGDYPGVCTKEKKGFYLDNCPNPISFILK